MPGRSKRLYFGLSTLLLLVTLLAAIFGAARIGYDRGYAAGQAQRKREHIVTRVYDADDLLVTPGDDDRLIAFLVDSVEPNTWSDTGGPGAISWAQGPPPTLIITQSEFAHEQIIEYLRLLRANQAKAHVKRP